MSKKVPLAGIGHVQDGEALHTGGSPFSFSGLCAAPALPISYVSPAFENPHAFWQEGPRP